MTVYLQARLRTALVVAGLEAISLKRKLCGPAHLLWAFLESAQRIADLLYHSKKKICLRVRRAVPTKIKRAHQPIDGELCERIDQEWGCATGR